MPKEVQTKTNFLHSRKLVNSLTIDSRSQKYFFQMFMIKNTSNHKHMKHKMYNVENEKTIN